MLSILKSNLMDDIQLLKVGDVKSSLLNQLKEDGFSKELESLRMSPSADAENNVAEEWLDWNRKCKDVQSVEAAVPSAIMSGAVLVDVKVGTGRRRQPDDAIYNRSEDVRRRVARGNCVLRLSGQRPLFLIHALKKFTGGMGDEDDDSAGRDDSTWCRYFLRSVEDATRVVLTQKANGEAAHLSARYVDGAFLVCVGSKNVHMVLRRESDIALYDGQRYRVAQVVAKAVWRQLAALDDRQRELLLSFLHHTRFTAVMELLQPDHQHVEDLSYLKEAELRFICWAPTFSEEFESFCGCSPELGFQLAKTLGLKTVDHSVVKGDVMDKLPQLMQEIREGYGYEGKVLYFVDDEGNVIGLLKKKTAWYILLRALREQLCAGLQKLKFTDVKEKVEKRFLAIQTWLGFDDQFRIDWLSLGVDFAKWLKENPATDYSTLRTMMPPLWTQFLRSTDRTDKLKPNISS